MKRTPIPRYTKLRPSGRTKAKKVTRQKAFYASAVWKRLRKEALARAGHQCEHQHSAQEVLFVENILQRPWDGRCVERTNLHVHHKTNVRFGGDELPEDLMVLCEYHHAIEERLKYPHRHTRRSVA